jgi:hypothetical protein
MAKKGRKKNKKNKDRTNPSESINKYTGPLVIPKKASQADTYSAMLFIIQAVTTNGSGVVSPVISTALTQWDETMSFQNIYDEWRLLAATAQYVPLTTVPTSTLTPGTLGMVVDRDTSTNLTGLYQCLEQGGVIHNPFVKGPKVVFRIESSEESAFTGSNTAVQMWFKMYGSGLAATQTYGNIVVEGLWQFRGRI